MWPHKQRWAVFYLHGIEAAFAKLEQLIQQYRCCQSASQSASHATANATAAATAVEDFASATLEQQEAASVQSDIAGLLEGIWDVFGHAVSRTTFVLSLSGYSIFAEVAASFGMQELTVAVIQYQLQVRVWANIPVLACLIWKMSLILFHASLRITQMHILLQLACPQYHKKLPESKHGLFAKVQWTVLLKHYANLLGYPCRAVFSMRRWHSSCWRHPSC